MYHGFFWGSWWFGWIIWLIIIVAIIWLVVSQNRFRHIGYINPNLESPLDILKKRYAKGEINKEQFEQMKKDLE